MKAAFIAALFVCCTAFSVASNITGASASNGNLVGVNGVTDNMNGMNIGLSGDTSAYPMSATVTATFAGGGTATCTFVGGSCSTAGGGVSVTAPGYDTIGSQWSISNASGNTVTSLTITLHNAAFNPCTSSGAITTDPNTCYTNTNGTVAPGFGRSISGTGVADGLNASVAYTNALQLISSGQIISNEYTTVTFTFSNFTGGTFSFYTDTDFASDPAPEPTSVSLVGLALVGLAVAYRRKIGG